MPCTILTETAAAEFDQYTHILRVAADAPLTSSSHTASVLSTRFREITPLYSEVRAKFHEHAHEQRPAHAPAHDHHTASHGHAHPPEESLNHPPQTSEHPTSHPQHDAHAHAHEAEADLSTPVAFKGTHMPFSEFYSPASTIATALTSPSPSTSIANDKIAVQSCAFSCRQTLEEVIFVVHTNGACKLIHSSFDSHSFELRFLLHSTPNQKEEGNNVIVFKQHHLFSAIDASACKVLVGDQNVVVRIRKREPKLWDYLHSMKQTTSSDLLY